MSRSDSYWSTRSLAEALRDLVDLAERHNLDASVGDDDFKIIVRARQVLAACPDSYWSTAPRCGHKWEAPYVWPPGVKPGTFVAPGLGEVERLRHRVPQECGLPRGHEGVHRSPTNVTCPE